jgi:hypothetical protein
MLPQVAQELRAGLSFLPQPYSDPVAVGLHARLNAAWPYARAMVQKPKQLLKVANHRSLLCEVLELLNKYWQWFLPGIAPPSSKEGPCVAVISNDPSNPAGPPPTAPDGRTHFYTSAYQAGMVMCVLVYKYTLEAIQMAGREAVAAASPHLVADQTGEWWLCALWLCAF